jgi:cobalt/nickel transport protein
MRKFVLIMLAVSLVIAGGISWFASTHPDGLERVAQDHGFAEKARTPGRTVLPDYTVPGLNGFLSNGLAGVIGVAATFGTTLLFTRLARKKKAVRSQEPGARSQERYKKAP